MRISDWSSDLCSSDLDDETLGQPGAHRLGDVGHRVEFGDAAVIDPVPDLLAAQLRRLGVEPGFLERGANPLARQAAAVDVIAAAQRNTSEARLVGKECVSTLSS